MVTQDEYKKRRQTLAAKLPADAVAIIPAAKEITRNADSHYPFRQDSDFYYLTGFNEPDALLLITSGACSQSILFNRPSDATSELWNGKRLGQQNAVSQLGVDEAYAVQEARRRIGDFLSGRQGVYFPLGRESAWEDILFQAWSTVKKQARSGVRAPEAFYDLTPILSELRLFKSPAELELMRTAAKISVKAHERAITACHTLQYEYQLEAELLYEFIKNGCRSAAYDSIVANGANACILHYTANNQPLIAGDLVLIDAGGEFENYAADITRTFPVNGRFSAEQKALYEVVLQAQQKGIALVKPGTAWNAIQETMVETLTQGLVDLGLLCGNVSNLVEQEAYKPFYMHSSGHWLGLDVHDCGRYKVDTAWRQLEPGMVLTVEPGLYISQHNASVPERWRGIGIRIEDDLHVTASGCENLTGQLATEIAELEAMASGR